MARKFFRDAVLESNGTDLALGIARLSFASELPVLRKDKRGKFWEVLSHSPGDANLGLLNKEGVVLENHDDTREIGVVEKDSAKVDADKKTRATIKIDDGHWQGEVRSKSSTIPVSVGYNRLSELSETPGPDGIPTRRYSWAPYEISLLTVDPADDTVGINRMKKRQCPTCDGDGICIECDGEQDESEDRCADCNGTARCSDCRGTGYFKSARKRGTVDLRKPLNVETVVHDLTPEQKTQMRILLDPKPADGGGITVAELETKLGEARTKTKGDVETAERGRVKEITVAADLFVEKHGGKNGGKAKEQIRQMAVDAIEKGEAAKDFNGRVSTHILNAEPEQVDARKFVPADDMAQFSIVRCLQQAVKNMEAGKPAQPDKDSVEGKIIEAFDQKCRSSEGGRGYQPRGFVIPSNVQFGDATRSRKEMLSEFRKMQNRFGRDMQADVFGAGGAAVPTFWLLPYIELLRNKSVLNRVGVRTLGGLTGNVIIPRLEAPATAYSTAEIAAVTASQETLGQIALTPKRVSAQVLIGKQLIFQSSPDIEALVRDDMTQVLALYKDEMGLNGQGSASQPLGIFNTPGIGTVTFGASATYAKIVSFQTAIRTQNVMGKLAYASTSTVKGTLKTTAVALTGATVVASGEQNALWHESAGSMGDEDGIMNGCQAIDSQQIPNNLVLAGVFDQFIEGLFGGFDVVVDPYTKAGNAEIVLTMNMWLDYACRHPQAFCTSTDAGNQ